VIGGGNRGRGSKLGGILQIFRKQGSHETGMLGGSVRKRGGMGRVHGQGEESIPKFPPKPGGG